MSLLATFITAGLPKLEIHYAKSAIVHHSTNHWYGVFESASQYRYAVVSLHSDHKDGLSDAPMQYSELIDKALTDVELVEKFGIEDSDWTACYTELGIDWQEMTKQVIK